jgi:1-acyl-sn-glycerol-3-phosphate acyltransferase
LRQLQQGALLGIFPEGDLTAVCRRHNVKAKGGAALMALRTRAPVFPACITGGPDGRSVLQAWLWPSAGVRVTFGPPIDLSAYLGRPIDRQLLQEVTALFMERIDQLRPARLAAPRREARPRPATAAAALLKAAARGEGFAPRPRYPRPLHGRARQVVVVGGPA